MKMKRIEGAIIVFDGWNVRPHPRAGQQDRMMTLEGGSS